jgi:glycosyltransferase involved in cell wall biosynthesis
MTAEGTALVAHPPSGSRPVRPGPVAAGRLQRVLYAIVLNPTQKFGSLEEQILTLARAFRDRQGLLLPLFITPARAEGAVAFREAGVEIACLDLERFRPGTFWRLFRLVRRHRIEVIHWGLSSPLLNGYVWLLSLLAPRVRHFFTDHNSRLLPLPGPTNRVVRLAKRLLLKRYARVLGVSRFVEECLARQGCWSNLSCCLHFINAERFRPDEETRAAVRARLGAEGKFVLVSVCFLIKAKGVDVAVRALTELPADVVLWVVGAGDEAGPLQELSRRLGLEERVRFLGPQPRVEPFLQAADCFVCPSLWAEAAGLVNLEAQACGLPVLASRIGGIPEYVAEGETGLLFPPGEHGRLAEAVRRLHGDPELRRRLAQAARARVEAHFSAEALLPAYLDLYRP